MNRRWLWAALCAAGLGGAAGAEQQTLQDVPNGCEAPCPAAQEGPASGAGVAAPGIEFTDPMDYPGRRSAMEMGRQDWDLRSGAAPEGTGIGARDHDRGTTARKRAPRDER